MGPPHLTEKVPSERTKKMEERKSPKMQRNGVWRGRHRARCRRLRGGPPLCSEKVCCVRALGAKRRPQNFIE